MVWQKARETGALPTRLIKPGEVFEWKTLEPWADQVTGPEDTAPKIETPPPDDGGIKVKPGSTAEVDPTSDREVRRRRTSQRQAATP